jgi:hypothetical protein
MYICRSVLSQKCQFFRNFFLRKSVPLVDLTVILILYTLIGLISVQYMFLYNKRVYIGLSLRLGLTLASNLHLPLDPLTKAARTRTVKRNADLLANPNMLLPINRLILVASSDR